MELQSVRGKLSTFLALSILLTLPTFATAAVHCVRSAATGSGSGADWTNAYTSLPSSLVRGDTYYVAAGTYPGHTFGDSGGSPSTIITIKAATVADHGTDTGWSASYVGQANFNTTSGGSIWSINQSYYVMDGAYRGADWKSGYGFHLDNTGSIVGNSTGIIAINASNVTIRNVNIEGSHSQGSPQDRGITSYGNGNLLIDKDYVHDNGNVNMLFRGTCPSSCNSVASNITVQYSYLSLDFSNPAAGHAEGVSFAEGVDNITFRYNRFVNVNGTGALANASSHTPAQDAFNGPFYIYGNLFWLDDALWPSWYATWCQVGGFFSNINIYNTSDLYVYNNTIANISDNAGGCQSNGTSHDGGIHFDDDGLSGGSAISPAIDHAKNNIWWNSTGGVTTGNIRSGQLDISNNTTGVSSSNFTLTSTPFDFHLTSHIAGAPLTNVGTYWNGTALVANTFNIDADGNTRTTWDEGVYELSSSSANGPTPPQGLTATVQ